MTLSPTQRSLLTIYSDPERALRGVGIDPDEYLAYPSGLPRTKLLELVDPQLAREESVVQPAWDLLHGERLVTGPYAHLTQPVSGSGFLECIVTPLGVAALSGE